MRMHQGSVLSPFLFAVVVDVVTEFVRQGALSELLYTDDLVLISETIEGLRSKFIKWQEAFESKGFKINLGKANIMVKIMAVNYYGRHLVRRLGVQHLPTIRRKAQPRIPKHAILACCMTGGLMGAFGCVLGRGI